MTNTKKTFFNFIMYYYITMVNNGFFSGRFIEYKYCINNSFILKLYNSIKLRKLYDEYISMLVRIFIFLFCGNYLYKKGRKISFY